MFKEPTNKYRTANFDTFRQRFEVTCNSLASYTVSDKICILISQTDSLRKFRYPILNSWIIWIWKLRDKNLKSFCLQFFLEPREPTFFRMTSPTVYDKNSFHNSTNVFYFLTDNLSSVCRYIHTFPLAYGSVKQSVSSYAHVASSLLSPRPPSSAGV